MAHRNDECERWLHLRETDGKAWDALPAAAKDQAIIYADVKESSERNGTWRETEWGQRGGAA